MPKPLKKTINVRLTVWVVSFVGILFVTTLSIMFHFSRVAVEEEALAKASLTVDETVLQIDNVLRKAEVVADNMIWNIEHHLDSPDSMEVYSRQIMRDNPAITGCVIGMSPFFFNEKQKHFMTYSYRKEVKEAGGGSHMVVCQQDHYGRTPYLQQNWYTITREQNKPCWVKPRDVDAHGKMLATYCLPIHDAEGNVVGVFGVGISLEEISRAVMNAKPFPDSYCLMIDRRGEFVIHPDSEKLQNRTIYDILSESPDPRVNALLSSIMLRQTGYKMVELGGKECYVFYRPFHNVGWVTSIVCPKETVLGNNVRLQILVLVLAVLGLFALMSFCLFTMGKALKPLRVIQRSAHRLADGHYEESIPQTDRVDEIGSLQNSFHTMQQSVMNYLDETRQLNAKLERSNEVLHEANEQAQEAERMMNSFVGHVGDCILEPVVAIEEIVKDMRQHNGSLDQESIVSMAERLERQATIMTGTLDHMLNVAQQKGEPAQ